MTILPPNPDDIDPNSSAEFLLTCIAQRSAAPYTQSYYSTAITEWRDDTNYPPLRSGTKVIRTSPLSDIPSHPNDKQFDNPYPRFKRCPYCKKRNIITDRFDGTCATCGKRIYDEVNE